MAGGKKCSGVIHKAALAVIIRIKNFAVEFCWLTN